VIDVIKVALGLTSSELGASSSSKCVEEDRVQPQSMSRVHSRTNREQTSFPTEVSRVLARAETKPQFQRRCLASGESEKADLKSNGGPPIPTEVIHVEARAKSKPRLQMRCFTSNQQRKNKPCDLIPTDLLRVQARAVSKLQSQMSCFATSESKRGRPQFKLRSPDSY